MSEWRQAAATPNLLELALALACWRRASQSYWNIVDFVSLVLCLCTCCEPRFALGPESDDYTGVEFLDY
jgi:hypothetical protein